MDTLQKAQTIIDRIKFMRSIPLTSSIEQLTNVVNASIVIHNETQGVHASLDKELVDLTHAMMKTVKERTAKLAPAGPIDVSPWLEKVLGGPASSLNNIANADHYKVTVDLLPLMKMAGGAWASIAERFGVV